MLRWSVCLVAGAMMTALCLPVAAQWKWRDASGRTQYSDLPPPPGTAAKDILARPTGARSAVPLSPSSTSAASAASAPTVEPELEARRKAAEQAEADKRKAEEAKLAAARADNCQRARDQLRTVDSGIRIAKVNPRGEREILDDAGRAEEARRAREMIGSDCR